MPIFQITRCHIPEGRGLTSHRHENLKYHCYVFYEEFFFFLSFSPLFTVFKQFNHKLQHEWHCYMVTLKLLYCLWWFQYEGKDVPVHAIKTC